MLSNLSAVSLTRLSPSSCIYRDCSKFQLNVQTPMSNPVGSDRGGMAVLMITAAGLSVNASFVYKAQGSPFVESYSPRSVSTTAATPAAATITFYVRNFPSSSCMSNACQDEVVSSGLTVMFGEMAGTLVPGSVAGLSGLLTFKIIAPTSSYARAVQGSIRSTNSSFGQVSLAFDFSYMAPPGSVAPSEGVTNGGNVVTITAYGWSAQAVASVTQTSSVVVSVCSTTAVVQSVLAAVYSSTESYVRVSARMPACSSAGTRSGNIAAADGSASAPFSFMYFKTPTITSATPNRATLDGMTTASDGMSTVLRVADLPAVQPGAATALVVTFAGVLCDGRVRTCTVTNIANSVGYVDVTVKVPAVTVEGSQPVKVTSGGRTAEGMFEYFVPAPEIRSVSHCPQCT